MFAVTPLGEAAEKGAVGPWRETALSFDAGSPLLRPILFHHLPRAPEPQRVARHRLGDHRPCRHVRAFANVDRRDECRVAPDERAVADPRGVLLEAVVVARDRPG